MIFNIFWDLIVFATICALRVNWDGFKHLQGSLQEKARIVENGDVWELLEVFLSKKSDHHNRCSNHHALSS